MGLLMQFAASDGLRLMLAVLMGGVIGLEREASDKPAGLRTNILICVGSTLMMILSIRVAQQYAVAAADPGRIAQGVITGIGFLGAGTILHSRGGITGLTTAATTWSVAGIGLALGAGYYLLAFTTTLLILAVLWILGRAAHARPNGRPGRVSIRVVADGPEDSLDGVRDLLGREGISPSHWSYRRLRDGRSCVFEFEAAHESLPRLLDLIPSLPGVRSARVV